MCCDEAVGGGTVLGFARLAGRFLDPCLTSTADFSAKTSGWARRSYNFCLAIRVAVSKSTIGGARRGGETLETLRVRSLGMVQGSKIQRSGTCLSAGIHFLTKTPRGS